MITSEKYGPQFDPVDGTIGSLQLVRRWALIATDSRVWPANQGRNTYASCGEALAARAMYEKNNPPDRVPTLRVEEIWCYPGHFDPVGGTEKEKQVSKRYFKIWVHIEEGKDDKDGWFDPIDTEAAEPYSVHVKYKTLEEAEEARHQMIERAEG